MSPLAVLKLVKSAKDVYDYVYKENNADKQLKSLIDEMVSLRKRIEELEDNSHPPAISNKELTSIKKRVSKLEKK
tara:strand:+ start:609 stop:833 length:225 start_codon:yes stop_codon:yes gene_type:complete